MTMHKQTSEESSKWVRETLALHEAASLLTDDELREVGKGFNKGIGNSAMLAAMQDAAKKKRNPLYCSW